MPENPDLDSKALYGELIFSREDPTMCKISYSGINDFSVRKDVFLKFIGDIVGGLSGAIVKNFGDEGLEAVIEQGFDFQNPISYTLRDKDKKVLLSVVFQLDEESGDVYLNMLSNKKNIEEVVKRVFQGRFGEYEVRRYIQPGNVKYELVKVENYSIISTP